MSQTIDLFFQRINDCVQYASDGKFAFTNRQILQTAYHAVSTLCYYTDACKDWRNRPLQDKTWTLFKRFFAAEYQNLKEQQRVNHSGSNFHSANAAVNTTLGRHLTILPWPPLQIVTLLFALSTTMHHLLRPSTVSSNNYAWPRQRMLPLTKNSGNTNHWCPVPATHRRTLFLTGLPGKLASIQQATVGRTGIASNVAIAVSIAKAS